MTFSDPTHEKELRKTLQIALQKGVLNKSRVEQLKKEVEEIKLLNVPVNWVELAVDKKWIDKGTILALMGETHLPGKSSLSELSSGADSDLALFVSKNGFLGTDEFNEAGKIQQKILQYGLYKKLSEIIVYRGWIDEKTMIAFREIFKLISKETYGTKKEIVSSSGLTQSDLQFARLILQNRFLKRAQVLKCISFQRILYSKGLQEHLGEICYYEKLLDKDQVDALLKMQTKTFKEKSFALSSLSPQDEKKDKKLVLNLQKKGVLSKEQIEEAFQIKKDLKASHIHRLVGEIINLKFFQENSKTGSTRKKTGSLAQYTPKETPPMQMWIQRGVIVLVLIFLGVFLEVATRTSASNNVDVGDFDNENPSSGYIAIKGNLFSDKQYFNYVQKFAKKNPYDIDGIARKYQKFARKYPYSPLVKKAKKEIKHLRSKDSREYAKLVKKVKKTIEENGKYGIPLAKDYIDIYANKYAGTIWEEKALALKKNLIHFIPKKIVPQKTPKNIKKKTELVLTEEDRKEIQKYLQMATHLSREFKYKEAIQLLKKTLKMPFKKKKSFSTIRMSLVAIQKEEEFFKHAQTLLESKKKILSFYWNQILVKPTKIDSKGVFFGSDQIIPWEKVPLLLFHKLAKIKRWEPKDYYGLGMFLSTHRLPTLGYRFLRKISSYKSPFKKPVEDYISRLENRFISSSGMAFYRDQWVRKIDYPKLSRSKTFYLEQWYDKGELLHQYGQRLAEKLKNDQRKVAREELINWRKTLYKERGVLAIDTMVDQGDPSKRVDVVIISEGFTRKEIPKFQELATKAIKQLRSIEPFRNYWEHINVHRIDLMEKNSGIAGTDEKSAITWLGCYVNALNQLKYTKKKVRSYSALAPDDDLVIIIANVKKIRATGGNGILCMGIDGNFNQRVVMGLGFAFANLTVEYVDERMIPHYPPFGQKKEYLYINATREANPKLAKWHYWNYPRMGDPKVGAVEGAYFRPKGFYRPTPECRMKSSKISHYCVVCLEQVERSFYQYVSPIDDFFPILPNHTMFLDDRKSFQLKPLNIKNKAIVKGKFTNQWFIDSKSTSKVKKEKGWIVLKTTGKKLGKGKHTIAGMLQYSNNRVKRDLGVFLDYRVWKIEVLPLNRPKVIVPKKLKARSGKILSFRVKMKEPFKLEDFNWKMMHLPERAFFDGKQVSLEWCPGEYQRGSYSIVLELQFKSHPKVKLTYPIQIKVLAPSDNHIPFFRYHKPIVVKEGELIETNIEAFDVDGDHLFYSIKGKELPKGASMDSNKGILRWRPTLFQGGTYSFKVYVSDGTKGRTLPIFITVENQKPTPTEKYIDNFGIFLGIRSPNPKIRSNAIKQLTGFSQIAQKIRWSVFLRDFFPAYKKRAFQVAQKWLAKKNVREYLLFLKLVEPYIMELMDEPKTLRLIRATIKKLKKKSPILPSYVKSIRKQLKKIDKYNKYRFKIKGISKY